MMGAERVKDRGDRMADGGNTAVVIPEDLKTWAKKTARITLREPFTRRTWSELLFLIVGDLLIFFSFAFVLVTMAAGVVLAITFVGLALIGLSVRGARTIGGYHRRLARGLLHEEIQEPEPFAPRSGLLGWIQSSMRDRIGWRAIAYMLIKIPVAILGVLAAFSVWYDAISFLIFPFSGGDQPSEFGIIRLFVHPGPFEPSGPGTFNGLSVFIAGILLFLLAPWMVRLVVNIDRFFMRSLLGPEALAVRVRTLEETRAQSVDASAATLRRIERDLHDGTQAQLVALAMQLGMAKEKLDDPEYVDLDQVRLLVNAAHQGAKETIVELRDLARGIHPPALDIGLAGALTTLTSRSAVPTEITVSLRDRPTPAIEAIAYFCVAELLANVAQHAQASRASVTCSQDGRWLRLVVRDDGTGGAQLARVGSSSSGLAGLTDRVHAVDGRFDIVSPPQGPTVITVDLPLHA
jgi:signal transduction histidine kinase